MRRILMVVGGLGVFGALCRVRVLAWRRNPRIGTRFVNAVVNPRMVDRGLAGCGRSEIGTLEHVGRRSGVQRQTPVHPEPTLNGFRIVVPLGGQSEWARNVLAAGHCRLQLHDVVYELDEPRMVPAGAIQNLPPALRRVEDALGFHYLLLRQFGAAPGALERPTIVQPEVCESAAGPTCALTNAGDLVSSTR